MKAPPVVATSDPQPSVRAGRLWDTGCLAVVVALGAALYVRAARVPWYLDDFSAIVGNPVRRSLPLAVQGMFEPRGFAYLSFALNDYLLGAEPGPFHVVNVAIHLASSAVVYALLRRLTATRLLALGGALLFVAHPIQTQAVMYAVQRMASLSAFFFLLSLLLFLVARDLAAAGVPFRSPKHLAAYASSLVFAGAAVLTKQNTIVFPAVFLIADRISGRASRRPWREALRYLAPFLLLALLLGAMEVVPHLAAGTGHRLVRQFDWFIVGYAGAGEPLREVTPLRYLVTELSVLWKYLRLLILPWGQSIDHGFPLVRSCVTGQSAAAALGLIAFVAVSIRARRRLPYLSFGIAIFLLGLVVESSVIPLDTMQEHRLYLPMLGFVLACVEGLRRVSRRGLQALVIAAVVLPLSLLTWRRNGLWMSPVAFYQDALDTYPGNPRLWALLGESLDGNGDSAGAKAAFEKALELHPRFPVAMFDLGAIYASEDRPVEAEAMYRNALSLVPEFPAAHRNLALLLLQQRRADEALAEFSLASRMNPSDLRSLYFEAVLANQAGDRARAVRIAGQIEALDPEMGELVREMLGRAQGSVQ